MGRQARIDYPGAHHHVFHRGNRRQAIFVDDADRLHALDRIGELGQRFGLEVLAYCLMTNHYHLFVRSSEGRLTEAMHWFGSSYAQYFNRRHALVGHLFQGRYGSPLVEESTYYDVVPAYIHDNPRAAGLVTDPALYPWSSMAAYLGLVAVPVWLVTEPLLAQFDNDRERFIESIGSIANHDPVRQYTGLDVAPAVLGSKEFRRSALQRGASHRSTQRSRTLSRTVDASFDDVVRVVASVMGVEPDKIRKKQRGKANLERMVAMYIAQRHCRKTLDVIAEEFELGSSSSVSSSIHRLNNMRSADDTLQELIEEIAGRLGSLNVDDLDAVA